MKLALIGLGKMGINLLTNMRRTGLDVVAFDLDDGKKALVEELSAHFAKNLQEIVQLLPKPRIVWVMIPAGKPTNSTVRSLLAVLEQGDIIIDGGNSYYKNSLQLSKESEEKGIYFLDCGSSGGHSGALNGGNFMVGGDEQAFEKVEPIFQKISETGGYLYTGPSGSGHYLKMIHNGIEYGMMEAIGEGFDVLEHSPYDYDNEKVAEMWSHGSVIRSWLIELAADVFAQDPHLNAIKGVMESSGEGRWTVQEALDMRVSIPVIAASLMMRYRSLEEDTFTGKVIASLRAEFGGHAVVK